MKCRLPAAQLKKLLKTVVSIYDFARESPDSQSLGLLSVEEDGLWIEYGSAGAYLRKRVEVTVLREGMVGIDLKALQRCKLTGEVTLDSSSTVKNLTVYCGKKNKYQIPKSQEEVEKLIESLRPDDFSRKRAPVEVPAHVLKLASSSVSYKSGELNTQTMIQAYFKKLQKKGAKGTFSLSGNDDYSFARYVTEEGIKVRKPLRFILTAGLLGEVMKEADPEEVIKIWGIDGGDERTSTIRFVTEGFDFCHPILSGEEFDDPAVYSEEVQSGTRVGYFVSDAKTLKSAFDSVNIFGTSADPSMVIIRVSKKNGVQLAITTNEHVAMAEVESDKIRSRKKRFGISVHSNYLGEFLKVMPKSLPMRVEKWDDMIRIEAENLEDGLIEYVVAQGDSDN